MHEAVPECWGPELGFHACTVGALPTEPPDLQFLFLLKHIKQSTPQKSMKTTPIRGEKGYEKSKFGEHFVNCLFYFYGPTCVVSLSYNGTSQMTSGNQKKYLPT